jgi:ABC-2 type transport system permease protein
MRNIWTVIRKEMSSYFHSPIAYIVLATFAFVFGYFFYSILRVFVMQSMMAPQYAEMMGQSMHMNVNEMVIRPLFRNVAVICLLMLPFITMRLFAEEKKTGTIELLMTSPLTDLQIILGKFFAAVLLYACMLAITFFFMLFLFRYGHPDWKPLMSGYLGMLLLGGCFLAVGLLFSTVTTNQLVAVVLTFGLLLMLWVIDWAGDYATGTLAQLASYLSITGHLENFLKGVLDVRDAVYYLSVTALSLFLTARSVESVRWRA